MSDILPKTISFKELVQSPVAWFVFFFIGLLNFFIVKTLSSKDENTADCREIVIAQRTEIQEYKKEVRDLNQKLYESVNRNIMQDQIIKNTDSAAREIVGDPAKRILKESK